MPHRNCASGLGDRPPLCGVPDHHRAVLHLTAVEGMSYQQCADVLGVPVGTVMSPVAGAGGIARTAGGPGGTGAAYCGGEITSIPTEQEIEAYIDGQLDVEGRLR